MAIMLMAFVCVGLAACGSDDDDGTPAGSTPKSVLTDSHGNTLQVSQAGHFWYRYDEQGRLSACGYDEGLSYYVDIDGSTLVMSGSDTYSSATATISLNEKGLISKHVYDDETIHSHEYYKDHFTESFTYNSSNQLIASSYSYSSDYYYSGKEHSSESTGTLEYSLTDGNLTKVVVNRQGKRVENGKSDIENGCTTLAYTYGKLKNAFKQFPTTIARDCGASQLIKMLAPIGLFGVGPATLPTTSSYTYESDDEKDSDIFDNKPIKFTLNEDGSIKVTYYEGDDFYYFNCVK